MDSYEPYGSDYYVITSDLFVTDPQTEVEGKRDSDDDDVFDNTGLTLGFGSAAISE